MGGFGGRRAKGDPLNKAGKTVVVTRDRGNSYDGHA